MTDNEIINGLRACGYNETCANCPYLYEERGDCTEEMAKEALDLINRQKEEIERLEGLGKTQSIMIGELNKACENCKSEAIREFAEKLKHLLGLINGFDHDCSMTFYHIDNLVKEMVGEDNA